MSPHQNHVLVIEDDPEIAALLKLHLTDQNNIVSFADTGPKGLEKALEDGINLVILDLMLPGLNGMEVCKEIRKVDKQLPILMLTARAEEIDKVLGLELGADDYLTKPFSIREFLARTKALLRRSELSTSAAETAPLLLTFGPLLIDLQNRRARLHQTPVDLTAKEWELLILFAKNPGRTYSRQELLDLVWGYQYDGYSHTVNSHINRLRNKIEKDPAQPKYVLTKRGLGYRFTDVNELEMREE